MQLNPLRIGKSSEIGRVTFALPAALSERYNRPLVGLTLTPHGTMYRVAAKDSDFDNRPW